MNFLCFVSDLQCWFAVRLVKLIIFLILLMTEKRTQSIDSFSVATLFF